MVGAFQTSHSQDSKTSLTSSNRRVSTERNSEKDMDSLLSLETMDFKEALHLMLHQEKVSRNEKDIEGNQRVLSEILVLCIQHKQWKSLGDCVVFVVGKHSCIQESARKFIQDIIRILDSVSDKEDRYNLIKTLRSVCDGKLYLEREHAEITKLLASLYEADMKLTEAADVLSELKIEAYGLLNPREKVQFILLQMRLLIKSEQQDKAAILSKKIQLKFFNDPANEDLKIKFYEMKIELERWTSYLETSKYYRVLSTCEKLSPELRAKMIVNSAIFCSLAPKCSEQITFTEILLKDPNLKKEPTVCELLKLLSSKELIPVSALQKSFQAALNQTKVMDQNTRFGRKCETDLDQRIIEHNILTIANYYSRINLARMAELIESSIPQCEENIARLVNCGLMTARIDRFTGIVDFQAICIRECVLNSWFDTVRRVMDCTNKASHHVQKEFSLNARGHADIEML